MAVVRDYYATLQVARDAEQEVIERAYKALSLKYHPDRVKAERRPEATLRMQGINEAYRILRDPAARRRYDATLSESARPGTAWDSFMNKGLVGMLLDKLLD